MYCMRLNVLAMPVKFLFQQVKFMTDFEIFNWSSENYNIFSLDLLK